jgi:hypothetical protein
LRRDRGDGGKKLTIGATITAHSTRFSDAALVAAAVVVVLDAVVLDMGPPPRSPESLGFYINGAAALPRALPQEAAAEAAAEAAEEGAASQEAEAAAGAARQLQRPPELQPLLPQQGAAAADERPPETAAAEPGREC